MYHVFSSKMLLKNTLPVTCSSSSTCAMQKITRIFLSHVHGSLMWKNVFYFRHFACKTVELWRVANCGVKPGTNKTTKTILAKPSKRKKTNSKCRKKNDFTQRNRHKHFSIWKFYSNMQCNNVKNAMCKNVQWSANLISNHVSPM